MKVQNIEHINRSNELKMRKNVQITVELHIVNTDLFTFRFWFIYKIALETEI